MIQAEQSSPSERRPTIAAVDGRRAIMSLDRLLQIAKTDAWNGSFQLDEALQEARDIVAEARGIGEAVLTTPAPENGDFERILLLSDGGTWETFDPASVQILDITISGFEDLCEGSEPSQLDDADILRRVSLAAAAFGDQGMLQAKSDRNESSQALLELMQQLQGIGIYVPGNDGGQWAGTEGLSFARAEAALSDPESPQAEATEAPRP